MPSRETRVAIDLYATLSKTIVPQRFSALQGSQGSHISMWLPVSGWERNRCAPHPVFRWNIEP